MSAEDDTVETGKFTPTFPVWVLFRDSLFKKVPASHGVVPFHLPSAPADEPPVLLVFTTESLAQEFMAYAGVASIEPQAVTTAHDLALICTFHRAQGTKILAVDMALPGGEATKYNIADTIKHLHKLALMA
jgi:hypothetical protein